MLSIIIDINNNNLATKIKWVAISIVNNCISVFICNQCILVVKFGH